MSVGLARLYETIGKHVVDIHGGTEADSPIESMMLASLLFQPNKHGELERIFDSDNVPREDGEDQLRRFRAAGVEPYAAVASYAGWLLFPQHKIGDYRADFAIVSYCMGKVVVECDGHDFHEKTKEQAKCDKARDRKMQELGWRVLRFTGSEIYNDSFGCGRQVLGMLNTLETEAIKEWARARKGV